MKTLIVYFSFTQNNEKLTLELQRRLNCDVLKIEELKRRNGFTTLLDVIFKRSPAVKASPIRLQDYGNILFIAPIWAGKIATPLKTFLEHEISNIKCYSFITVCGGNQDQKEKIHHELSSILHNQPVAVTELRIHDLLNATNHKLDSISTYRISVGDLKKFENQIADFIKEALPMAHDHS